MAASSIRYVADTGVRLVPASPSNDLQSMAFGRVHAGTMGIQQSLRAVSSATHLVARNVPDAGHYAMEIMAYEIRDAAAAARLIADQLDTAADAAFAVAASNLTEAT